VVRVGTEVAKRATGEGIIVEVIGATKRVVARACATGGVS
jgi:hypothetical protein